MSTFTASLHQTQVKKVHAGVNAVSSKLSLAVTGTASSVILLAKVPHGATIVDFQIYLKDGGTDQTWKVGLQLPEGSTSGSTTKTESALLGETSNTGAAGVVARPSNLKLPFKVSISDEAQPRWAWVTATCAAAISASADMSAVIFYTMDQDQS